MYADKLDGFVDHARPLDCLTKKTVNSKKFGFGEDIKLARKGLENVRCFFSLVLEDSFGHKEELMDMAEITDETLQAFFETEFHTTIQFDGNFIA